MTAGVSYQGLLQIKAWVSTKWSPINSFFSSLILIFHQYSVSKIHFIMQSFRTPFADTQTWSCRRPWSYPSSEKLVLYSTNRTFLGAPKQSPGCAAPGRRARSPTPTPAGFEIGVHPPWRGAPDRYAPIVD